MLCTIIIIASSMGVFLHRILLHTRSVNFSKVCLIVGVIYPKIISISLILKILQRFELSLIFFAFLLIASRRPLLITKSSTRLITLLHLEYLTLINLKCANSCVCSYFDNCGNFLSVIITNFLLHFLIQSFFQLPF